MFNLTIKFQKSFVECFKDYQTEYEKKNNLLAPFDFAACYTALQR